MLKIIVCRIFEGPERQRRNGGEGVQSFVGSDFLHVTPDELQQDQRQTGLPRRRSRTSHQVCHHFILFYKLVCITRNFYFGHYS